MRHIFFFLILTVGFFLETPAYSEDAGLVSFHSLTVVSKNQVTFYMKGVNPLGSNHIHIYRYNIYYQGELLYAVNEDITLGANQFSDQVSLELSSNFHYSPGGTIKIEAFQEVVETKEYCSSFVNVTHVWTNAPTNIQVSSVSIIPYKKYIFECEIRLPDNEIPIREIKGKVFLGTNLLGESTVIMDMKDQRDTLFQLFSIPRNSITSTMLLNTQLRMDLEYIGYETQFTTSTSTYFSHSWVTHPENFLEISSETNPLYAGLVSSFALGGPGIFKLQYKIDNEPFSDWVLSPFNLDLELTEGPHTITISGIDTDDNEVQDLIYSVNVYPQKAKPTKYLNFLLGEIILKEGVETVEEIGPLYDHEIKQSVTYSNEYGKEIAAVTVKGSSGKKDIYQYIEFDRYGRKVTTYLPFVTTTNDGSFDHDALEHTLSYYKGTGFDEIKKIEKTDYPFTHQVVERSPEGTIFESGSVGLFWQPESSTVSKQIYSAPFPFTTNGNLGSATIFNQTFLVPGTEFNPGSKMVKIDFRPKTTVVCPPGRTHEKPPYWHTGKITTILFFKSGELQTFTNSVSEVVGGVSSLSFSIPPGKEISTVSCTINNWTTKAGWGNETVSESENYSGFQITLNLYLKAIILNTVGGKFSHSLKSVSRVNLESEVFLFDCPDTGIPALNPTNYYLPGEITVNETTDENGQKTVFFKDRANLEICRKSWNKGQIFETYNIYDEDKHLRFILPPNAIEEFKNNGYILSPFTVSMWATEFRYDDYGRVVYKKIPESDPIYTIYDQLGRIALTQDGKLRQKNQWMFVKYDRIGRSVVSGVYSHFSFVTREEMQALVSNGTGYKWEEPDFTQTGMELELYQGYTHRVFPTDNIFLYGVTYYDTYSYPLLPGEEGLKDFVSLSGYSSVATKQIKGFVTGSRDRILHDNPNLTSIAPPGYTISTPVYLFQSITLQANQIRLLPGFRTLPGQKLKAGPGVSLATPIQNWISSAPLYDDYGRVIQVKKRHNGDGVNYSRMEYDFPGRIVKSTYVHNRTGLPSITIKKRWEYNNNGQTTKTYQQVNNQAEVVLSENKYNDLGTLVEKNLYSINGGTSYYQSLDFRYTERGWLKNVNQPNTSGSGFSDPDRDAFAFELFYQDSLSDLSGGTHPKYNGTITASRWRTLLQDTDISTVKQYTMGYDYDEINRLERNTYGEKTGPNPWLISNAYSESGITYDKNGNIQTLKRTKNNVTMDDLTYFYVGNKIGRIKESVAGSAFPDDQEGNNLLAMDLSTSVIFNCPMEFPALTNGFPTGGSNSAPDPSDPANTMLKLRNQANYKNPSVSILSDWIPVKTGFTYKLSFVGKTNGYDSRVYIDWYTSTSSQTPASSSQITFSVYSQGQNTGAFPAPEGVQNARIRLVVMNTLPQAMNEDSWFDNIVLTEQAAYAYDENGSMIADANKGLSISYNLQNLPVVISSTGGTLRYLYTASGIKLSQIIESSGWVVTKDYIEGFEYLSDNETQFNELKQFSMEEGRMRPTTPGGTIYRYEFDIRDNLGNTRVTISDLNGNGVFDNLGAEVLQADDYYPFGLRIARKQSTAQNLYTFNGKEEITDLGVNWYEYGARNYDPNLGRWWCVDPVDEYYSAYIYVGNNPVNFIDPDGKATDGGDDGFLEGGVIKGGEIVVSAYRIYPNETIWNWHILRGMYEPYEKIHETLTLHKNIAEGGATLATAIIPVGEAIQLLRAARGLRGVMTAGEKVVELSGKSVQVELKAANTATQAAKVGGDAAKGVVGKGFNSFSAFKRAMGPAGPGQAWHHIVEQTPGNIAKFGNQAVHNTGNLMKLPHGAGSIHARVSGYYSSIQPFTSGQTVRQWLSTQSYQAQYDFGIQTLKNFGWTP